MNKSNLVFLIVLCTLILFSALFSAAEASITSLSKTRIRQIRKGKSKKEKILSKLLSAKDEIITSLLIGNNIVNILSSSIATKLAIDLFGAKGLGIASLSMTILLLLFGEITPKTIGSIYADSFSLKTAFFINLIKKLLFPFVCFFSGINRVFLFIFKKILPEQKSLLSEEELKTIIDLGQKDGALEKNEHKLINQVFTFSDIKVKEIMSSRTNICAISNTLSLSNALDFFLETGYSRLPIYQQSLDNIIGLLHYKDILFASTHKGTEKKLFKLNDLLRPVLFVPETQDAWTLLKEMKEANLNLAIVLDEYGLTAGLITLDDAVAAVFGKIKDEYDIDQKKPEELIEIVSPGHIRVPGELKLIDLNPFLKTNLDSEWFETIGGFILEQANKLPSVNDRIKYKNLLFVIEEISKRKINKLSVYFEPQKNEVF